MNKRILLVFAVVGVVALLALVGCSSPTSSSSSGSAPAASSSTSGSSGGSDVTIQNFSFNPSSLTVKAGTTVTWTNKDSATHTVTGSGWESGELPTGTTYSHKFDTAGTYAYHCSIHPSMTGTIIVQ